MAKCSYCGKETKDKITINTFHGVGKEKVDFYYCSEEHKKYIEEFTEYVNKNAIIFIVSILLDVMVLPTVGIIVGATLKNDYISAVSLIIMGMLLGLLIYRYPFATPTTNNGLGLKKSIKLTKTIGIGIFIVSVIVGISVYCYWIFN